MPAGAVDQKEAELRAELRAARRQVEIEKKLNAAARNELQSSHEQLAFLAQALNHAYIALKERDAQDAIPEDAGKIVQLAKQLQQEVDVGQSLQQRLNQLRREKVDMENALEAEQELIVNKLAKEMERLRKQKHLLQRQKTELEAQVGKDKEYINSELQHKVERLAAEKEELKREKRSLKSQVGVLASSVSKLSREKVELEVSMEMEEDGIVNKLMRQIDFLVRHIRRLEARLDSLGQTARVPSQSDMDHSDHERAPSVSSLASSFAGSLNLSALQLTHPWPGTSPPGRASGTGFLDGGSLPVCLRRSDVAAAPIGALGHPYPLSSEPSSPSVLTDPRRRSGGLSSLEHSRKGATGTPQAPRVVRAASQHHADAGHMAHWIGVPGGSQPVTPVKGAAPAARRPSMPVGSSRESVSGCSRDSTAAVSASTPAAGQQGAAVPAEAGEKAPSGREARAGDGTEGRHGGGRGGPDASRPGTSSTEQSMSTSACFDHSRS